MAGMEGKYRICARAIIYREGKILAARHKDLETGEVGSFWATPGGGVDFGETIEAAMRRESIEELGREAKVGRLLFVQHFYHSGLKGEKLEFFFLIKNPDDYLDINLHDTTHGFELAEIDFVDPSSVEFRPRFLSEVDLRDYCENVREVKIFSYLDR